MNATATPPSRIFGCDVGKNEIVVFDGARLRRIANRPEALAAFVRPLDRDCLIVCEATGGYELTLLAAALDAGVPAHHADARKVKAFIRSFGTLGKTDAIDARALARYGRERQRDLPRWHAPDPLRLRLQTLTLFRRDLVADRTAYVNRRQAPGAEPVAPYLDDLIADFERQIDGVEAETRALIAQCEPLAKSVAILRQIPGLGANTAVALIALMPELGALSRKKIAALAGLAPHPRQSGAVDAYRPLRGGRPEVRRTLFMAALAARRHNPALRPFFERLVQNGKKPIVAIAAVMRKLVVIANAKLRDGLKPQLS
jgi:transposase